MLLMKRIKAKSQQWLSMFLVAILLVSLGLPMQQVSATAVELEESIESTNQTITTKERVEKSIEKIVQYYKNMNPSGATGHSDYWLFLALRSADEELSQFPWKENKTPWTEDTYWTNGLEQANRTSNEDAGAIIGSVLLDQDPRAFGQRDVVQDLVDKQQEDGSFFTIWGESWAMIALDIVGVEYERDQHIDYILGKQSDQGMFGDIDSTGWILTALAPYASERTDVKEAIALTVQGLHAKYLEEGVLANQWGPDANTTAAALMGLAAVEEDLLSDKWSMDGENIVDQFIDTYQQEDGSFWWREDMAGAVGMSTEQSLLALNTILKGYSVYLDLYSSSSEPIESTTKTVTVRVEGASETIYPETEIEVTTDEKTVTALDAIKEALNGANISLEAPGGYISQVGDEGTAIFGAWDGWQYLVNNNYPSFGADEYVLEDGDQVTLFYGNVNSLYKGQTVADKVDKLTLQPNITVAKSLYAGEAINVSVTSTYNVFNESDELEKENVETPIQDADVYFNGESYKTDHNGIARIPGEKAKVGTYELKVTKDIENSYPRLLRQAKKILIEEKSPSSGGSTNPTEKVTVSVETHSIGKGYIVHPKEITLRKDDTAFTVMERAVGSGSVQYIGSGASLYVQAIDGLGEFDEGPESGWLYEVNGKFPEYSAGLYTVKDGDTIRWRYTTNLGKDLEDDSSSSDNSGSSSGGSSGSGGGGSGGSSAQDSQSKKETIHVDSQRPFILEEEYQKDATKKMTLVFDEDVLELPKLIASRENTTLEISEGTKVTSKWDGKLLVPTKQKSSNQAIDKINETLMRNGQEISTINTHIKVGGNETIRFDQHVKLTFKGGARLAAGLIHTDGKFELIGENDKDDVYFYTEGKDLIVQTKHFTEFLLFEPIEKTIVFQDVQDQWFRSYVEEAVKQGIFTGYKDGSFKPNRQLTRAQAASILVRALELETKEISPFTDIEGYAKETQAEISAAAHHGLVKGYADGRFKPGEKVTRSQLALMLYRAYEQKMGEKYTPTKIASYTDIDNYDAETQQAISMLFELEIATGKNGEYMPGNRTTRAHASKMIVNFLKEIN